MNPHLENDEIIWEAINGNYNIPFEDTDQVSLYTLFTSYEVKKAMLKYIKTKRTYKDEH